MNVQVHNPGNPIAVVHMLAFRRDKEVFKSTEKTYKIFVKS